MRFRKLVLLLLALLLVTAATAALADDECTHPSIEYKITAEGHQPICPDCGYEYDPMSEHFRHCDSTDNACEICGYVAEEMTVNHAPQIGVGDETGHWAACSACGERYWELAGNHFRYCDSTSTVCDFCGYEAASLEVVHREGIPHSDASNHWNECSACGEVSWGPSEHFRMCDGPEGVCVQCGYETTDLAVYHSTGTVRSDASGHWDECSACGAVSWGPSNHYRYCDSDSNACDYCGYEAADMEVYHQAYKTGSDASGHWDECTACGEVPWGPLAHYRYCDSTGTGCDFCGYEAADLELLHREYKIGSDASGHWEECAICGELSWDPSNHYRYCDSTGTGCDYCGYEAADLELLHWDYTVHSDASGHWDVCNGCGEVTWGPYEHWRDCDGDACAYCGYEASDMNVIHSGNSVKASDERGHWEICETCGEVTWAGPGEHYRYCDTVGTGCDFCGYEAADMYVYHRDTTLVSDASGHWYECTVCGENLWDAPGEHYRYCDSDGNACETCGYETADLEVYHREVKFGSDASGHWDECVACGEVRTGVGEHYRYCDNDSNVCEACGYETADLTVYHGEYDISGSAEGHWYVCHICFEKIDDYPTPHYRHCDAPEDVCEWCHYPTTDLDVIHYDGEIGYDDNTHWEFCSVCGERSYGPNEHYKTCDTDENVCDFCGLETDNIATYHSNNVFYEDEEVHGWYCTSCGEEDWMEEHWFYCDAPDICGYPNCNATYNGQELRHRESPVFVDGGEEHVSVYPCCGEEFWRDYHVLVCTDNNVCEVCGLEVSGDVPVGHVNTTVTTDEHTHTVVCDDCGEVLANGEHFTLEGDPEGICSFCGEAYESSEEPSETPEPETTPEPDPSEEPSEEPSVTPEPDVSEEPEVTPEPETSEEPTEEPTEEPEEEEPTEEPEEEEPTEEPGVTVVPPAVVTPVTPAEPEVTEAPALDGDSFLNRFRGESALAAAGDVFSGELTEPVTLVMEADENDGEYEGGELTVYPEESREDHVVISLVSHYTANALARFRTWQASVTTVEEVEEPEDFDEFVELARALIQALLPDTNSDSVDEYIVELLLSGNDGTLEGLDADFGDDIDGEIIGYLATDGYEIFLVMRGDSAELLVREIK